MTFTIHILWWYIPALIAAIGVLFVPFAPGGILVSIVLWIVAVAMVIGHYTAFMS